MPKIPYHWYNNNSNKVGTISNFSKIALLKKLKPKLLLLSHTIEISFYHSVPHDMVLLVAFKKNVHMQTTPKINVHHWSGNISFYGTFDSLLVILLFLFGMVSAVAHVWCYLGLIYHSIDCYDTCMTMIFQTHSFNNLCYNP